MAQDVNIRVNVDTSKSVQATASFRTEMRQLREEMANLQVQTNDFADASDEQIQRYNEMAQRVGQLTDAMGDQAAQAKVLSDDYRGMHTALEGVGGGIAVFQGLTAATDMLGLSNENSIRVIKKLQSAQAALNAVNQIQKVFNKDSYIMTAIRIAQQKQLATSTAATATATSAGAAATNGATVATRSFTAALMSNPIFALAAVITGVTAALIGFSSAIDDDTSHVEDNTEATDANTNSWQKNAEARREALASMTGGLMMKAEFGDSEWEKRASKIDLVVNKLGIQVATEEEAIQKYAEFYAYASDRSVSYVEENGRTVHNTMKGLAQDITDMTLSLKKDKEWYENNGGIDEETDARFAKREEKIKYLQMRYDMLEKSSVDAYKKRLKDREDAAKKQDAKDVDMKIGNQTTTIDIWRETNNEILSMREQTISDVNALEADSAEVRKQAAWDAMEELRKTFDEEVDAKREALGIESDEEAAQNVLFQEWLTERERLYDLHYARLGEIFNKAEDEQLATYKKEQEDELKAQQDIDEKKAAAKQQLHEYEANLWQASRNLFDSIQELELASAGKNAAKQKQIKKNFAIANGMMDIGEIGIQTAKGIMGAWSAYAEIPFVGPALAGALTAVIAALGGAQTAAAIVQMNTKIKMAAKGDFVSGPSHANGGVMYNVEGGEAILNKRAMAIPEFRAIASAMNVATGGVAYPSLPGSSPASGIGGVSADLVRRIVADTVAGVTAIPVVVSEQNITDAQTRRARITNMTAI